MNAFNLTPQRIHEQVHKDLKRICIHESAHLITAFHLGVYGTYDVWETPPATLDEFVSSGAFAGRCKLYAQPKTEHISRCIGLAGVMAELMVFDHPDDQEGWGVIQSMACLEDHELSETDLAMIGDLDAALNSGAAEQTFKLLRTHWQDVELEARLYMEMPHIQQAANTISRKMQNLLATAQGGQP